MNKLLLSILFLLLSLSPSFAETAYERVLKTQTLRCGYGIFEPQFMLDPNTEEASGVMVDIMKAVGKELGITVEFVEEVDWGQIPQALNSDRVDAFCPGMWGTANRGANIGFTTPLYYSTIEAFARADDNRFDNNRDAINDPAITIATNDGDVTEEIADQFFPKAKRFAKIQIAGEEILLLNVETKKGDVTFTAPSIAQSYMQKNPGKLKQIPLKDPILVYKHVVGVKIQEHELRLMLNGAIEQLQNNGVIDRILKKYDADEFFRTPVKPYKPL